MEEVKERRNKQDLLVLPGSPILPLDQQKSDYGKSSLQGGKYLLQSWEDSIMLTEEQRERFANLFLRKLLQNLANKDCKNESELKQFIEAMDRIREKELRMQKNNMEKSVIMQQIRLVEVANAMPIV